MLANLTMDDVGNPTFTQLIFTSLKATALFLLVVWTITANALVFVVLYKNPKLQTVPNFLVGNLAFSDLCLSMIVLPLSSLYAVAERWVLGQTLCEIWVSADILCCTASIWNLSIVGLDRYWAITSPVAYMTKRNQRTAVYMIGSVWVLAAIISLSPLLGWKQMAATGNYIMIDDGSPQCSFLDLPSYTVYSATGSFFVPTLVIFWVYYRIYRAFAKHQQRQVYRQKVSKVIRKHIESTILHELPPVEAGVEPRLDDEDEDEDEDEDDDSGTENGTTQATMPISHYNEHPLNGPILEESETTENASSRKRASAGSVGHRARSSTSLPATNKGSTSPSLDTVSPPVGDDQRDSREGSVTSQQTPRKDRRRAKVAETKRLLSTHTDAQTIEMDELAADQPHRRQVRIDEKQNTTLFAKARDWVRRSSSLSEEDLKHLQQLQQQPQSPDSRPTSPSPSARERLRRRRRRRGRRKPKQISAAKERRGVKVLGIILGCFTVCWTPFFVMYLLVQFCAGSPECKINPHVEMFITWLGYSNSAMNPIIYTVFNRDYQIALKRIFGAKVEANGPHAHMVGRRMVSGGQRRV